MLTNIETTRSVLPAVFDLPAYRAHNPGLEQMTDAELLFHYQAHGRAEGRICSEVHSRDAFLRLVPASGKILEIGPGWAPAFRRPGFDVTYVDVIDQAALQRAADEDPAGAGGEAPEIDYLWRGEPYRDLIREDFDVVFACHAIEHQPNLVSHLRDIAAVLRPSGMCALIVHDHRYGVAHFRPTSDITDVLEAHVQGRTRHAMANVMAWNMMHTHPDPRRHWLGDHGDDPRLAEPSEQRTQVILKAMAYQDAADSYIDVPGWHFTPESFASIVTELHAVRMIPLQIARVYPTIYGAAEFYAFLQKR